MQNATLNMDEISCHSATSLVALIRRRELSPVELVKALLRRIEHLNPTLNAIVTTDPEIVNRAKEAEAAVMRGEELELLGLPLTVKDTIQSAGLRFTSGSLRRAEFVAAADATAVARLRAAGALILGKTNAAEMAMDYTADNPLFGRTNNPYDLKRSPGGSSGGEAAAISSCLSPAGLGSDLAGSIRVPAHFCGIAGLKPGAARIPGEGQFPPASGPYSLGAALGPMARRVEDLRMLFRVLVSDPKGPRPISSQLDSGATNVQRIGFYTDDGTSLVTEETRIAVEDAACALADAGFTVEQVPPPGIDRGYELWLKLFARASVVQLREVYSGHESEAGDFVRWRLNTAEEMPSVSLDDYIKYWMERDRLREELLEWMEQYPVLLMPVGATPALEHGTLRVTVKAKTFGTFRAFSYCQTFNVFDLPSVSVPAGRSRDGLPIGVQVVGRPWAEEALLDVAAVIEQALGGWQPPAFDIGEK